MLLFEVWRDRDRDRDIDSDRDRDRDRDRSEYRKMWLLVLMQNYQILVHVTLKS